MPIDHESRYRAVQARDARFDGVFYTAVRTTGIYCRPSCPAVTPKPQNVTFLPTAAAAQEAGYRACRRCRPDTTPGSPEWNVRADAVGRAMQLIGDGLVERVREIAPDGITASVDYVGTSEAIEASAELIADRSRSTSNVDPTAITEAGGRYCFVRPQADDLAHLAMLVDKGVLAIEVQQTFPLADAVKALRTNMEGHVRGKLALTVD